MNVVIVIFSIITISQMANFCMMWFLWNFKTKNYIKRASKSQKCKSALHFVTPSIVSTVSQLKCFTHLLINMLIDLYPMLQDNCVPPPIRSDPTPPIRLLLRSDSSVPELLHTTCSAYIFGNNGRILMFKVSKRLYRSA